MPSSTQDPTILTIPSNTTTPAIITTFIVILSITDTIYLIGAVLTPLLTIMVHNLTASRIPKLSPKPRFEYRNMQLD